MQAPIHKSTLITVLEEIYFHFVCLECPLLWLPILSPLNLSVLWRSLAYTHRHTHTHTHEEHVCHWLEQLVIRPSSEDKCNYELWKAWRNQPQACISLQCDTLTLADSRCTVLCDRARFILHKQQKQFSWQVLTISKIHTLLN